MERVRRLPLRVERRPGEPAYGLLARLTVRHNCSSPQELIDQLHGCQRHFVREVQAGRFLNELARLSGFSEPIIRSSTIIRDRSKRVTLGRTIISETGTIASTTSYGRICSLCLQDDIQRLSGLPKCRPWRRTWWDIAGVSSCPKHGIALTTTCPSCRHSLSRKALSPRFCRCGFDLLRCIPDDSAMMIIMADVYLVGRLGFAPVPKHPFLDRFHVDDTATLMVHLGRAVFWGRQPPDRYYDDCNQGQRRISRQ